MKISEVIEKEREIVSFSEERARILLEAINIGTSLKKMRVSKPNSIDNERTELRKWLNWYKGYTECMGETGVEQEVIKLINQIDIRLESIGNESRNAFEELISVIDKQNSYIHILLEEVKEMENIKEEITNKESELKEEIEKAKENNKYTPLQLVSKAAELLVDKEARKDILDGLNEEKKDKLTRNVISYIEIDRQKKEEEK